MGNGPSQEVLVSSRMMLGYATITDTSYPYVDSLDFGLTSCSLDIDALGSHFVAVSCPEPDSPIPTRSKGYEVCCSSSEIDSNSFLTVGDLHDANHPITNFLMNSVDLCLQSSSRKRLLVPPPTPQHAHNMQDAEVGSRLAGYPI